MFGDEGRQGDWDPAAAASLAEISSGAVDCTLAGVGLGDALGSQGWRVTGHRLWWRQDFSPSSHIEFLLTAEWCGEGETRAPWLKAVTYEPSGRLHNVDDLSPWDSYDVPDVVPNELEYSSTIHLRASGPESVPGRIVFKPASAPSAATGASIIDDEDFIEDEEY